MKGENESHLKGENETNIEWIAYKFDALQRTEISQTICYAFNLTRQLGLEDSQTKQYTILL